MKALSIQQPWAFCITNGTKRVENRTWGTKQRGWILIHAGKAYQTGMEHAINADSPEMDVVEMKRAPRGAIVGMARMIDCIDLRRSRHDDDLESFGIAQDQVIWTGGPFAFVFDEVHAFPQPFPYKGALGFFDVFEDYIVGVAAHLSKRVPA
jgi:hypothetical protein